MREGGGRVGVYPGREVVSRVGIGSRKLRTVAVGLASRGANAVAVVRGIGTGARWRRVRQLRVG
jgi:hypothetical protein